MAPTPWTAFTFFGIPLVLGILGGVHAARELWRAYRQYTLERVDPDDHEGRPAGWDGTDSLREQVGRGIGLLAVSGFLLVHSGRWLLSIYGYL
jgi:hypothetical protein